MLIGGGERRDELSGSPTISGLLIASCSRVSGERPGPALRVRRVGAFLLARGDAAQRDRGRWQRVSRWSQRTPCATRSRLRTENLAIWGVAGCGIGVERSPIASHPPGDLAAVLDGVGRRPGGQLDSIQAIRRPRAVTEQLLTGLGLAENGRRRSEGWLRGSDTRTLDRKRAHYEIERELADRLRTASADEKLALYTDGVRALFEERSDHPQLTVVRTRSPPGRGRGGARLPRGGSRLRASCSSKSELGDCALAREVARTARVVYALDVSESITSHVTRQSRDPGRSSSDGVSIDVPEGG